jgi:hypothetical protein
MVAGRVPSRWMIAGRLPSQCQQLLSMHPHRGRCIRISTDNSDRFPRRSQQPKQLYIVRRSACHPLHRNSDLHFGSSLNDMQPQFSAQSLTQEEQLHVPTGISVCHLQFAFYRTFLSGLDSSIRLVYPSAKRFLMHSPFQFMHAVALGVWPV